MIIDEINFKLKDGRDAILRSPKDEDAESSLNCAITVAGETDFLLFYPEEFSTYTVEGEKEMFKRRNTSLTDGIAVCVVDKKVVGICRIYFSNFIKTKHIARVDFRVLKEYYNQGIGSKMVEALIHVAESKEDVLQIELGYLEGNSSARHLYEKMGFRITSVMPNAYRLKDNTFLNMYMMVREIKR